jgi:flagellar biogenesis protein FliO
MLYLLVILLWIMINIVWLLQDMGSPEFQPYIRLDILAVDGVGGLKSLQDITVKTLFLYFICITLAIISDVSPFTFLSFESFFRIILLIAGLGVFIFMIHIVRRIVRGRIETEIDKIDAGYRVQQDRLIEISHGKDSDMNLEALNPVKASLDAIHTQRQRMLDLYVQCKGYDAVTLVKFSSSFILSLIAFIQKVWEFASKIKPV